MYAEDQSYSICRTRSHRHRTDRGASKHRAHGHREDDCWNAVTERATCLRRVYGAIIVKNDEIISTGYNGAPRGRKNCVDLGYCTREAMQVPRGQRYELCRSVHAEMNAIISAQRSECIGGTLFLAGRNAKTGEYLESVEPCSMCRRVIINAGIKRVVMRANKDQYQAVNVQEWVIHDDSIREDYDLG